MRSFIAAIAAVLSSMRSLTWRLVKEGGRLIMKLVPGEPPMPVVPLSGVSAESDDSLVALRRVAGVMAQDLDPTPEMMIGLADRHFEWLRCLDRRSLCRVMAADEKALRAHLKGNLQIRGLMRADRETIQAVLERREREDSYEPAQASLAWTPAL